MSATDLAGLYRSAIALTLAVLCSGRSIAAGEGRFSPGEIVPCDSVLSDSLSRRLIVGTGSFPRALAVRMTIAGGDGPFTLYHDRTDEYLWREPISSFKRAYWFPSNDIATIALHRTVDIGRYVRRSVDDEDWSDGKLGWRAIVAWDTSRTTGYEVNDIDLGITAFPPRLGFWGFRQTVNEIGFLRVSGQSLPLLYTVMNLEDGDEDTYIRWENFAFWYLYGDRFAPLGVLELERTYGESFGIDRLDLETICQTKDTDGDGDEEICYARSYIIAQDGRQTEFRDVGTLVFEFTIGDPPPPPSNSVGNVSGIAPNDPRYIPPPERAPTLLRPVRMLMSDNRTMPTRTSLPVLIFPGEHAFGGFETIKRGQDRSMYDGPPKGGGQLITLGKNFLSTFEDAGSADSRYPSLALRLFGDSVEFVAAVYPRMSEEARTEMCQGQDYSLLVWIDRELRADFGDSECNSDDQVYHVRGDTGDATCSVTKYAVINSNGDFTLSYSGQSAQGVYSRTRSPDHEPHQFHWKLSQSECGLLPNDSQPRMCGMAVEMVCGSGFDTRTFDYKSSWLSYPVGFTRTDPRTWGWMVVADRKDTTYTDRH